MTSQHKSFTRSGVSRSVGGARKLADRPGSQPNPAQETDTGVGRPGEAVWPASSIRLEFIGTRGNIPTLACASRRRQLGRAPETANALILKRLFWVDESRLLGQTVCIQTIKLSVTIYICLVKMCCGCLVLPADGPHRSRCSASISVVR